MSGSPYQPGNDGNGVPSSSPSSADPVPAAPFDPTELLSRIWQQNLPLMRARVATLEHLAQQTLSTELTPEAQSGASDLAHKLAGSLGMFGYPRGTEIAREMEQMLESRSPLNPDHLIRLAAELRAVLLL